MTRRRGRASLRSGTAPSIRRDTPGSESMRGFLNPERLIAALPGGSKSARQDRKSRLGVALPLRPLSVAWQSGGRRRLLPRSAGREQGAEPVQELAPRASEKTPGHGAAVILAIARDGDGLRSARQAGRAAAGAVIADRAIFCYGNSALLERRAETLEEFDNRKLPDVFGKGGGCVHAVCSPVPARDAGD
jgi:hypothetical protein